MAESLWPEYNDPYTIDYRHLYALALERSPLFTYSQESLGAAVDSRQSGRLGLRPKPHIHQRWLGAFVASVAGAALLLSGGVLSLNTLSFVRNAAAAEGTVKHIEAPSSGYVVEFWSKDEQYVSFVDETYFGPAPVGGTVAVIYDPSHPEKAMIDSWTSVWAWPLASGAPGLVVLALGLLRLVRAPSAKPQIYMPGGLYGLLCATQAGQTWNKRKGE